MNTRFNDVTHETTYTDPSERRGYEFSSGRPHPVGESPRATPFSGAMSPVYGHGAAAAPGNDMMHSFMSPAGNGYISPPTAPPAAHEYIFSQPGSVCISPRDEFQQQHQYRHHHHQHQQIDYPVETRSPRSTEGGTGAALSHRSQGPQERLQAGRRGAPTAPFGQGTTSIEVGGYRWEECYRQADGKKFWRHKETGVILTKDPYR